jgi:hypothetical protein
MKYVEDIRNLGDSLEPQEYRKIVDNMSHQVSYVICTYPQYAYLETTLTPQERTYGENFNLHIGGRILIRCRRDTDEEI